MSNSFYSRVLFNWSECLALYRGVSEACHCAMQCTGGHICCNFCCGNDFWARVPRSAEYMVCAVQ